MDCLISRGIQATLASKSGEEGGGAISRINGEAYVERKKSWVVQFCRMEESRAPSERLADVVPSAFTLSRLDTFKLQSTNSSSFPQLAQPSVALRHYMSTTTYPLMTEYWNGSGSADIYDVTGQPIATISCENHKRGGVMTWHYIHEVVLHCIKEEGSFWKEDGLIAVNPYK